MLLRLHRHVMASSLLRPYELPPFEVVKLIQPAFASTSSSTSSYAANSGLGSGSFGSPGTNAPLPGVASSSNSSSWNGAASPPPLLVASASASASTSSPPTTSAGVVSLSNRLSQLVAPKQALQSSVQIQQGSRPSTSQSLDGARSFNSDAGPVSKQVVRTAEAGGDTVYIGGNEGGLAVWKLDPFRSKGKQRAMNTEDVGQQDTVSSSAEEVSIALLSAL